MEFQAVGYLLFTFSFCMNSWPLPGISDYSNNTIHNRRSKYYVTTPKVRGIKKKFEKNCI